MFLEIIATNENDCLKLAKSSVDRIELCSNLDVGGLTPDIKIVEKCSSISIVPMRVMIRESSDSFSYNDFEVHKMIEIIQKYKHFNIEGFVFGCNDGDMINEEHLRLITEACYPKKMTYHRAFDEILDKNYAIKLLDKYNVDTVLTNFGLENINKSTLESNFANFNSLNINLLFGGGVTDSNLDDILNYTNNIHIGTFARLDNTFNSDVNINLINEIKSK